MRARYELIEPHEASVPRYRSGAWRSAFERTSLFTRLEEAHFGYDQEMDAERLVLRLASMSFIAVLPTGQRRLILDRARELVADLGVCFVLPHVVDVFWCTRR